MSGFCIRWMITWVSIFLNMYPIVRKGRQLTSQPHCSAKCFSENDRPLVENAIANWFGYRSGQGAIAKVESLSKFEHSVREGEIFNTVITTNQCDTDRIDPRVQPSRPRTVTAVIATNDLLVRSLRLVHERDRQTARFDPARRPEPLFRFCAGAQPFGLELCIRREAAV